MPVFNAKQFIAIHTSKGLNHVSEFPKYKRTNGCELWLPKIESESESSITQYRMEQANRNYPRSLVSKAVPILRTNAGKCYLIIGLGCILVVIFGVGFILYTVNYKILCNKLRQEKYSMVLFSEIM